MSRNHLHKFDNNGTDYWDPLQPGISLDLSQIREPILFIEVVLTRFRGILGNDGERYISEERCGCLPPCFERNLALTSVKEAETDEEQMEDIEVFYDIQVGVKVFIKKNS